MEPSDITDYAMPLIRIERLTRQTHDLCLAGKFIEANELALQLTTEGRILSAVLALMDGQQKKLNHAREYEVRKKAEAD